MPNVSRCLLVAALFVAGCSPTIVPDVRATGSVSSARHVFALPAEVARVVDGDTVAVHLKFLPGKTLHDEHVRVEGIDAPEMKLEAGVRATEFARFVLPPGSKVIVFSRRKEKYGRVLGSVRMANGEDFGTKMVGAGHAVRTD